MKEREALKLALEALERIDLWLKARYSGIGLVGVELEAITAIKEALAKQSQIEKQMGEIIKSLRCPNCESLERQNAELDLRLAEQDQVPFGFLTNKRQRLNFEPNATGLSNMPMTIDWNIPLYGAPQPHRNPLTDEQIYQMWTDEGLANSYEIYSLKEHVRRAARAIEAAHGIKE